MLYTYAVPIISKQPVSAPNPVVQNLASWGRELYLEFLRIFSELLPLSILSLFNR
jgi:hypothetical protein